MRFLRHTVLLFVPAILLLWAGAPGAIAQPSPPDFPDPVEALGEVFILHGRVLDSHGRPVVNALVEIWQTDSHGAYDHPQAPQDGVDENFQHFGADLSDGEGAWAFRTVVPGEHTESPLNIHFRVRVDDEPVLTSRLYFATLPQGTESDAILTDAGDAVADLLLTLTEHEQEDGGTLLVSEAIDIVLPLGAGDLTPTVQQPAGPYYPVLRVADYDNDLVVVSPQAPAFTLLNLNTATRDEFQTIPNVGDRMTGEFLEYRPYVSILQFRRDIGKYVSEEQLAAWEAWVYVPVDVNNSDAATLMQLPGVDDEVAAALMEARPFASQADFLALLAGRVEGADAAMAQHWLADDET
ncbi:MAG: hypothetical protein OXH77_01100 [Anaerolineaceae bacterium]|nr:hypothetical protein [Anaerolineaceae bacterium]